MKHVHTAALFLLVFLFSTSHLFAQETVSLELDGFVNDDYPALTFEVTPKNRFGVPLDQLTEDDFEISDEIGRLAFDLDASADPDEPISLMLVLDASQSMQASGQLSQLQAQAIGFRDSLGQFDQLGVLFFSVEPDGTRVELFPNADGREFAPSLDGGGSVNFINRFAPSEPIDGEEEGEAEAADIAPLYDAMFRGVQVLARDTESDRRAIIVITDSVDDISGEAGSQHADMDIVISTAQQENVPIFTIGLANGDIDAIELTKIARSTGGAEQIDQTADGLAEVLNAIAARLKTSYSVTAQAQVPADNEEHDLTVQVNANGATASVSQPFVALYPIQPIIKLVYITNENEPLGGERLAAGVAGTVDFQPSIFARNSIARVEYFIEDSLVHQATQPPYRYTVNVSDYFRTVGAQTDFKVVAIDNSDPPNTAEYEVDMLVLPCGLTCVAAENNFTVLDTGTFMAILSALAVLISLLLFFVVFSLIRRRRNIALASQVAFQQTAPGTFTGQPSGLTYADAVPVIPKTDEAIDSAGLFDQPPGDPASGGPATIVDSTFTPGGPVSGDNSPSVPTSAPADDKTQSLDSAPPATEILDRPPTRFAYLFNPSSGKQHQLNQPQMTIGRLPENRIFMPDPSVSSKHAVIKVENGAYVIYDLGASNPILINEQSIFGSQSLENNDKVTIGRETWVFKELEK